MSDNYIQNRKDPKFDGLLSLIPVGEKNAISMKTISKHLDISVQDVRQWVENARLDGMIIASSQCGYYIPVDEEELMEYYVRTKRRLNTTKNTLVPVVARLEDLR